MRDNHASHNVFLTIIKISIVQYLVKFQQMLRQEVLSGGTADVVS